MRFWDSSALVLLVVEQRSSPRARQIRRADPGMLVWAFTQTEIVSAVFRLEREGDLDASSVASARKRIDQLANYWSEIDAIQPVRDRAERLLCVHPLSAADALQLSAAVMACGERTRGRSFVCGDERLATAARSEGFSVIVP